jgi:hypothetical protein
MKGLNYNGWFVWKIDFGKGQIEKYTVVYLSKFNITLLYNKGRKRKKTSSSVMHYANIEMECLYGLLQMPWAFFHTAI